MTNFNFEGQPEGDWEDRGNTSWSELDWQRFLQRQDREVSRFLRYYDECPVGPTERLDWVARQMGWDSEDWSVVDFPDDEEESEVWKNKEENPSEHPDSDPYTLHRHPVYVVTAGLFLQVRHIWRTVLHHKKVPTDALLCWDFAETLAEGEKQGLLAMQSMDMGDYMLCVLHLKRSLRAINLSMSLLPKLAEEVSAGEFFKNAVLSRLFDLREVCIRVIQDCRGEDRRS
ncbi:MAG: hypothetical protein ACO3ZW_09735 [Opitutales bacterium]|jgi:hypothetical protein